MNVKKICFLLLLIHSNILCDNIITFFFQTFPRPPEKKKITKKIAKITKPGKLAKYIIKPLFKKYIVSGIFCSYQGYLAISDLNGQVILPRRHKDPEVNILITNRIIPMPMMGNTIHHWEIDPDTAAKMFFIQRCFDREIGAYFWETKEIELPKDRVIDKDTIVVIAKPKYFSVPIGINLTTDNTQLYLPAIYVRKNIRKLANSLYIFTIKNFFQIIDFNYKKEKAKYIQQFPG